MSVRLHCDSCGKSRWGAVTLPNKQGHFYFQCFCQAVTEYKVRKRQRPVRVSNQRSGEFK